MLKIKDGFNLKDLEKYGFKFIDQTLIPRYTRGRIVIYYDIDVKLEQSIEKINEIRLKHRMTPMFNRAVYIRYYDEEVILMRDEGNDIFDLINAEIIEKTEEV